MTASQLDMVTTMHEKMTCHLNALEVLHKGWQKAVDAFMSSSLTGIKKLKSAAIATGKRNSNSLGEGGGGSRKRNRCGGGGGGSGGGGGGPSSSGGGGPLSSGGGNQGGGGQNFYGPRPNQSGIQCGKCNRFGHKTADCRQSKYDTSARM
jgi:hypothetical protein